jgi:site-specific DNA-methyltransferase (adenine-specific)
MFDNNYNPDVLNCLANLSNDEVFTSPKLANLMLDLLPQEIWSDPYKTFLDPCTKTGIFLREITKRLDKGLEILIPDRQERINHILKNQVFGIAITELTSLTSKRTLYCSKDASSKYSVCTKFKNPEGNIKYENYKHEWDGDRCKYCGASKKIYNRGHDFESHAYQFIHTTNPEEIFNMKFDVIIGNPPYQLSDGGGTGDSAKPIYNEFIDKAVCLNPKYISFIIPSRWMKGGKGLNTFRSRMIDDTRISEIHDFFDEKICFPNVNIDGGVNFFLWDRDYNGKCNYYYHITYNDYLFSFRFLKEQNYDKVIRDPRQRPIINKSLNGEERFSLLVSSRKPYGISSDLFNNPSNYGYEKISKSCFDGSVKIYGVKGKKGGATRTSGYIHRNKVDDDNSINKFKLFFSKAYMLNSTIPPEIILAKPNEICTETFLRIGCFDNERDCLNCLSYIKTKFFRALLLFNRHSLNISTSSFDLIPVQDFSESWTDEKLYKKYNLTQEEIDFIESMIKPME